MPTSLTTSAPAAHKRLGLRRQISRHAGKIVA